MSKGPHRSFAGAVAQLAGVRLAVLACMFVVSVVGARVLSPADYGAAGVAITLGMVAALICNGGVNIAVISLAGRAPERLGAVLAATALVTLAGAVATIAVTLVAGLALGAALKLPERPDLFAAAALVGAGIVAFEYGGAVLLALGRPSSLAVVELMRGLAILAATIALLMSVGTDTAFVIAASGGYLLASAWAVWVAHAATGAMVPAWHPEIIRRGLGIGLRGQAGNVLQFLNLRVDMLLIPALLQLPAVGVYLVAVRVAEVVTQVPNAVGSLVFPAVARQVETRNTDLTERAVRMSILVVTVEVTAVVVLTDAILAVAFGPEYAAAGPVLRILAVAMIPLSIARILAADLKGRGRPGLVSAIMLAALIITLVLDLLLIPAIGIVGAAIASLAAYTGSAALLMASFLAVTGARLRLMIPGHADVGALVRATRGVLVAAR
jgi:stage V sporulation protein B